MTALALLQLHLLFCVHETTFAHAATLTRELMDALQFHITGLQLGQLLNKLLLADHAAMAHLLNLGAVPVLS